MGRTAGKSVLVGHRRHRRPYGAYTGRADRYAQPHREHDAETQEGDWYVAHATKIRPALTCDNTVFPVDVLMKHVDALVKHYNAHNRHPSDLYRLVANADQPFSRILVVQCLQIALTEVQLPEDASTPPPWISPRLTLNLLHSKVEYDAIISHLSKADRQLLTAWSQAELRTVISDHGIPSVTGDGGNVQLQLQATTFVSMRNMNSVQASCTSQPILCRDGTK